MSRSQLIHWLFYNLVILCDDWLKRWTVPHNSDDSMTYLWSDHPCDNWNERVTCLTYLVWFDGILWSDHPPWWLSWGWGSDPPCSSRMGLDFFVGDGGGQSDSFWKEGDWTSSDGAWRELASIGLAQVLEIFYGIVQPRAIKKTVSAFIKQNQQVMVPRETSFGLARLKCLKFSTDCPT